MDFRIIRTSGGPGKSFVMSMEILLLEATGNTPGVLFDPGKGTFEISGRSLADNASAFYAPLAAWMERYSRDPNPVTDLALRLEYVNTGSSKMLLDLFFILRKINGARVSWYFQEDDEDMEETGEEFAQLAGVPFELKAF